jgi:purine-binding chemotaxis protein CheW
MDPGRNDDKRRDLRRRLKEVESQLVALRAELAKLGPGEPIPGLFLLVESKGLVVALPASQVVEIVRLVETTPLPEAPPHVLGTFSYRGDPVVAVDLSRLLNRSQKDPEVDAHMIVLATSRPMALVVDRVHSLVESPVVAQGDPGELLPSRLVEALCRAEDRLVPVLRFEPLLEGVPA